MDKIAGNQLRGHLDSMILAALEKGETHGLKIIQRLELAGCGLLSLKEGSLYPALYRLEALGHVSSSLVSVPAGQKGAKRRIYQLTRSGRKLLKDERQRWTEFSTVMNHILGVT